MRADDGRIVSNVIGQCLRGEDITLHGDGLQTRSFCYVDDTVEGLMRLMASEGPTIPVNIGNPEEITICEFIDLIIAATSSPSSIVRLPLPVDDPRRRKPDIARAKELLDWSPTVSLAEGIERTIAWFRADLGGECGSAEEDRLVAAAE
jgi:UDP-glucuronate decarboxylase